MYNSVKVLKTKKCRWSKQITYIYLIKLKRMRVTNELVQKYFETLVAGQPDDVVNMLMELFNEQINQREWIALIAYDVYDTYKDE